MKSSILKLSSLVLLFSLLFMFLVIVVFQKLDNPKFYQVPEDKNVLIIGNSQSEGGLDDKIIGNSINLSQGGDCSFYNYFKGKKIIEDNPQINTVLFLYTNNMFLKGMDEWSYDEKHLGFKYPKYGQNIDMKDQWLLFIKNPGSFLIALRDAVRTDVQLLFSSRDLIIYERLDWGGYEGLDVIGDLSAQDSAFNKFYADTSISILDLNYVEKFYEFCKSKNVELILVRTPFHHLFPRVKESDLHEFHKTNLEGIVFYYYLDTIFYDHEFKDVQHLNTDGSVRLSKMIQNQLLKDNFIKTF